MESKYFEAWKEFARNEEFWNEVLVGRSIRGVNIVGTPKTATSDQGTLESVYQLTLDSGERVHLAGEPGWGNLDLIAPPPDGLVGQTITALEWDPEGIAALVLQHGRIDLDKASRGRFWIVDGHEPRRGIVARAPRTVIEELMAIEDRVFLAEVDKAIAALPPEKLKGALADQVNDFAVTMRQLEGVKIPGYLIGAGDDHQAATVVNGTMVPEPRWCQTCDAAMTKSNFVRDVYPPIHSWTCPAGHVEEERRP